MGERPPRAGDDADYQADQTASVIAFLAAYSAHRSRWLRTDGEVGTLSDAVDTLIDDIAADDAELVVDVWEDFACPHCATFTRPSLRSAVPRCPNRSVSRVGGSRPMSTSCRRRVSGVSVMGLTNGTPDHRIDAAGLHLADALQEYDSVERTALSDQHLTRLADHVSTTLDTLFRNPTESRVAGLARYEGDRWRTGHRTARRSGPSRRRWEHSPPLASAIC